MTVAQRILYGAAALALLFVVVWGDAEIARRYLGSSAPAASLLARGSLIPLGVALACLFGAGELTRILRSSGAAPCARIGFVVIVLSILGPWLAAGYACGSDPTARSLYASIFVIGMGVVAVATALVLRGRVEGVTRDAGATCLLFLYLGLLPSFAVHIRSGLARPGGEGAWLLLALVFVVKASDIGAYFTGTFVGRHKLAPSISPGKSVEGAIGGVLFSGVVAMWLLRVGPDGVFATFSPGVPAMTGGPANADSVFAFFIGSTLSVIGQIGDLFESCFKRDAGIKDSGRILPRFGGMLDLVDSPLLALPAAWVILTLT